MTEDHFESAKFLITSALDDADEVRKLLDDFFGAEPYYRAREIDPTTQENLIKIGLAKRLPNKVRARTCTAIDQLRHALDQACYAAAASVGGPTNKTYFPFASNPDDLEKVFASRSKHIPGFIRPYIRSLQPYPTGDGHSGGDNQLRILGTISGPNKHTVSLDPIPNSDSISLKGESDHITSLGNYGMPLKWDRKKQELEVIRAAPDAQVDINCKVQFSVIFCQGSGVEGANVLNVLDILVPKVSAIVDRIESEVRLHTQVTKS